MIIIRDLANSSARFCELERSLRGISPRTLSLRLRELESHGLVERRTFAEVPPRVEYTLTAKGRDLMPIVESMRKFGQDWLVSDSSAPGDCMAAPKSASKTDKAVAA